MTHYFSIVDFFLGIDVHINEILYTSGLSKLSDTDYPLITELRDFG